MSYGDNTGKLNTGFSSVCDMVRPKDAVVFKRMTEAGFILVATAGNESFNNGVGHPACVSDVFSAGACTKYDDDPNSPVYISKFSDHSHELVDILAPGNEIRSATLFDVDIYRSKAQLELSSSSYFKEDGTSMATPIVSGAFALLKQAVPGRTVNEYKRFLPEISQVEAKIRRDPDCNDSNCTPEYQFPFPKKVLNFDGFEKFPDNVPAPAAQESLSVLFYRLGSTDVQPKTGHNHLNTTEAGPFAFLSSLEPGDRIMLTDEDGVMQIWHVSQNVKIPSDGFTKIAGDLKENMLVLITCEDEAPKGGYINRRIIFADMNQ